MNVAIPAATIVAYALVRFRIDDRAAAALDQLQNERAYFARLFASDKRCLHHARCTNPGPKNVESAKVYTAEERLEISREYAALDDKKDEARVAREAQRETRKKARRLKSEP